MLVAMTCYVLKPKESIADFVIQNFDDDLVDVEVSSRPLSDEKRRKL